MICFPNAKINIGLNILRKREDGFHDLESCFYPIPLYDALETRIAKQNSFEIHGAAIPGSVHDNLCVKAYKILKADYPIAPLEVHLLKNIPIGAGLGGGSADAAFFLKLINDLFQLGIDSSKLELYASRLGSDCAFFIQNKPAMAFGRGDRLKPGTLDLSGFRIVLVKPDIHISTAQAYSGVVPNARQDSLEELLKLPVQKWEGSIKNDFEPWVFYNYPQVEKIKNELYRRGAIYASMSGSGSSVFAIFGKDTLIDDLHFPNSRLFVF